MHIEILTEDKSGATIVRSLASQILDETGVSAEIAVRPHRGCGSLPKDLFSRPPKFASSLLDLLPAKCRAYNDVYGSKGGMILVVIMDSDDKDPDELRSELYEICARFAPDLKSVIGLCTEEIEAWMLGDAEAILKAYPDADTDVLAGYVQDSVCGTWEVLCRMVCPENADDLIEVGYPAIGHYKARWAETISEYMKADNNISPSFQRFKEALVNALHGKPVRSGVRRRSF